MSFIFNCNFTVMTYAFVYIELLLEQVFALYVFAMAQSALLRKRIAIFVLNFWKAESTWTVKFGDQSI